MSPLNIVSYRPESRPEPGVQGGRGGCVYVHTQPTKHTRVYPRIYIHTHSYTLYSNGGGHIVINIHKDIAQFTSSEHLHNGVSPSLVTGESMSYGCLHCTGMQEFITSSEHFLEGLPHTLSLPPAKAVYIQWVWAILVQYRNMQSYDTIDRSG